jgi:hypothetical protein
MRIVHVVLAGSMVVTAGFGFSAVRAQQTPKGGTSVVVFKSPT